MATFAVELITRAGLQPTYNVAAVGGDEFVNTGAEYLHVKNGAVALVLTIETGRVVDGGLAVADRTVSVPATQERIIGPFPTADYNDVAGKVQLTYDDNSNVTIAVLRPEVSA